MTDLQRQLVFATLLGDLTPLPHGDLARMVLEAVACDQLEELEPIIDRMLTEAFFEGVKVSA